MLDLADLASFSQNPTTSRVSAPGQTPPGNCSRAITPGQLLPGNYSWATTPGQPLPGDHSRATIAGKLLLAKKIRESATQNFIIRAKNEICNRIKLRLAHSLAFFLTKKQTNTVCAKSFWLFVATFCQNNFFRIPLERFAHFRKIARNL